MSSSALVAVACGQPPRAPGPPPTASLRSPVERPAVSQPDTTSQAGDWDPSTPVDPSNLTTRNHFVVVEQSALCPTPSGARARDCGHSVEFRDQGQRLVRGERVTIVAAKPVEGLYRALRYQKAGILPGWVAASDVAATPSTQYLDAWDRLPEVQAAVDAPPGQARLGALPTGTVVRWGRTRSLAHGVFEGVVLLFLDLHSSGKVALALPAPSEEHDYVTHHDCLVMGDCHDLAYVCDADYCDEVSILARAAGRTVPGPIELAPFATQELPLFELVVMADRFGLFRGVR